MGREVGDLASSASGLGREAEGMAQREATRGETASSPKPGALERWFKLAERGTNLRTEIMAGVTVFMTMSYIIFVSPNILADAGVPQQAAFGATIYASAFASILMGLWANLSLIHISEPTRQA